LALLSSKIAKSATLCGTCTTLKAAELGYHVTLVRDGTAARSPEAMYAAIDIDGPTYAHAILTTAELTAALKGEARE
jgi:nicotinamidase-related amidase